MRRGALISMVTGGYFYHRLGKRSLFIAGIVVHSIGILTLFWVDNQSQLMLLIMAYLLMGTGGGISANTAQISALIDFKDKDLLQGSVLWNINRQVAFSVGTVVLISLFNLVSFSSELVRYQYTFFIAAILGLLSLISVIKGK